MSAGWEAEALLRELTQAWDAYNDDAVGSWERKMQDAVDAAKEYLAPRLEVDADPAPKPRCLP